MPESLDRNKEKTVGYLKKFIKDLESSEERMAKLLRFWTGSDTLIMDEKLHVEFQEMTDFQRRPMARTCSFQLILSSCFPNYTVFKDEFMKVIEAGVWVMDEK